MAVGVLYESILLFEIFFKFRRFIIHITLGMQIAGVSLELRKVSNVTCISKYSSHTKKRKQATQSASMEVRPSILQRRPSNILCGVISMSAK